MDRVRLLQCLTFQLAVGFGGCQSEPIPTATVQRSDSPLLFQKAATPITTIATDISTRATLGATSPHLNPTCSVPLTAFHLHC